MVVLEINGACSETDGNQMHLYGKFRIVELAISYINSHFCVLSLRAKINREFCWTLIMSK